MLLLVRLALLWWRRAIFVVSSSVPAMNIMSVCVG
jgi:hypothetical protein